MSELFSPNEKEAILKVARGFTGGNADHSSRNSLMFSRVLERIRFTQSKSVDHYLQVVKQNANERAHFISAVTIHTTSWFREQPHFEWIKNAIKNGPFSKLPSLSILSAACSTGQEVYSLALMLEQYRTEKNLEYSIVGVDVDPVSVETARAARYAKAEADSIPLNYRKHLLSGRGSGAHLFTVHQNIRTRVKFGIKHLQEIGRWDIPPFDLIVCRNVLIYFTPKEGEEIIEGLTKKLKPKGILCLGLSEAIPGKKLNLNAVGPTIYAKEGSGTVAPPPKETSPAPRKKTILCVDDSQAVLLVLRKLFQKKAYDVYTAESAEQADKNLHKIKPDIMTLDVLMPGMNGVDWLAKVRRSGNNVPAILVSSTSKEENNAVLNSLQSEAQDFYSKEALSQDKEELFLRADALAQQFRNSLGGIKVTAPGSSKLKSVRPDVIAIGASTGGTEAILQVVKDMPQGSPPVLIVQHLPAAFAAGFATRIADVSGLKLGSMAHGSQIESGCFYIALDDYHIGLKRTGGAISITISNEPPVNRHRPSVDILFDTASRIKKIEIAGILLTGMGTDGARGLAEICKAGHNTIAQDEASSVVFGMPKEAIRLGAAKYVGNLSDIRMRLHNLIKLR